MDKTGLIATGLSVVCAVLIVGLGYYDLLAGFLLGICIWLGLRCANLKLDLREHKQREMAIATAQMQNQITFINSARRPY